ncbi:MAG TPA: cytochrome ubiquinol oxidase subunit I [Solirubrobacteraceae bacterium]|jgi:cytochrome d ubiquinol oxidase subunit I
MLHTLADPVWAAALSPVEQQHLLQARQMQALSFAVHIPLVCFGIAFPSMVMLVESLYVRTGDELYRTLAKRWSKMMMALFAVGVVTGTILSFEMGLLWPNFMATFGGVFGLAFGLEGFSFFLEAIFIAIYVYSWDRMSSRKHLLCGVPVVLAGFSGSLFVLSVNAWMNHPGGFRLDAAGKVTHVEPWRALFANGHLWPELAHMYLAGFIVTGFVVAAAYAWGWLKGRRGRYERIALAVPLTIAALASPVQLLIGDWIARRVTEDQPTKLAAMEGLGPTTRGAPIHILGWYEDGKVKFGIEVPQGLSLLARHKFNATIRGLEAVAPADRPPVNVVRVAFQTMVGIGTLLAALSVLHLVTWFRRRRFVESRWFHWGVVAAGPLSLVALIAGWVTTEVGRQPWVVYGVMRTSAAVTGAGGIPVGYATLVVVYLVLAFAVAWILGRLARRPLDVAGAPPPILETHGPG